MTLVDGQKTELLQQVMDGLATAVLLFNRELKLLLMNPAGEMLFRSTFNHLREAPLSDWFPLNETFAERIEQAFRSTQPFHERELVLQVPMQGSVTVDCMATTLVSEGGGKNILFEMTPLDRNIRISREENQLSQNNAIRALIRGLAHEVKNPLGGLRGAAQLLERELESEELKEYTQVIIGEADRLRNLVNRLLLPSSLPQIAKVNIHEITERVRQIVEAGNPSIKIRKDYDPSIPPLLVDKDHVIQSLLNIVGNAAQALEGKPGKVTIRTRTDRQITIGQVRHKLVCIVEVIDNGPGIPTQMLESIFFPMVTTRANGSGLGLPIAQSLIHQNGGLVSCESEAGKTVFRVLLPIPDDRSKHEYN